MPNTCIECGKVRSQSARTCPHCGHVKTTVGGFLTLLGLTLGTGILLVVVIRFMLPWL